MPNLGPIVWFVFVAAMSVVAMVVLRRRSDGAYFAIVLVLGALMSFGLLSDALFLGERIVGVIGVLLTLGGCFGLIPQRRSGVKCHRCGYDLARSAEGGGARCPECGEPKPSMDGHCIECMADISSALAGGTIKCPVCGAPAGPARE